jgi:bifunctional non-homologous end joining protein LigD
MTDPSVPTFVTPMAAQLVERLPDGPEWLYELKVDGYRALLIRNGRRVEIRSRNDKDLTRMYPTVASAGLRLNVNEAVIDGEIVALDAQGRPSFQALQHRGSFADHVIVFYAFDVLYLEGRDMMREPLHKRRAKLPKLVDGKTLRLSVELPGSAEQIVEAVRAQGLEGVIAKRKDSPYQAGERSGDWVKLKLDRQQEFVIGGYRPAGSQSVDALLVGYYEAGKLRFAGKVRAGFVAHSRRELALKLKPLHVAACPFTDLPTDSSSRWGGGVTPDEMRDMRWTQPTMVAQIRFVEWTADGRLRHSFYLGLRSDKSAREVTRER